MSDEKFIPLDKIHVPQDRLRPMDDSRALIIAASVKVRGLINPITVRPTPNGAAPYTLIAGARRLRACQLLGLAEIEAKVRKGDAKEARAVEVDENLIRDDLSALQRAYFVREFKTLWEQEHGEIKRGNPLLSNSSNLPELGDREAAIGFYALALDRIGLSEWAIRKCCQIADHLSQALRAKLEGTEAADNQSLLLRLSKMAPADQAKLVSAIDICGGDLDQALQTIDDAAAARVAVPQWQKHRETVLTNLDRLSKDRRRETVKAIIEKYPDEAAWALQSEAAQ